MGRTAHSPSMITYPGKRRLLPRSYLRKGISTRLIPLIPFLVERERIKETVETVRTISNVLDTRINTGDYAYV